MSSGHVGASEQAQSRERGRGHVLIVTWCGTDVSRARKWSGVCHVVCNRYHVDRYVSSRVMGSCRHVRERLGLAQYQAAVGVRQVALDQVLSDQVCQVALELV